MVRELWFYVATVLICIAYPLLMQSYPRWRVYVSVGFAGIVICGGVLTYFDAKQREDEHTKMAQLQQDLEDAKKETKKQEAAVKDASDKANSLAQQLQTKTQDIRDVLKEQPKVEGEIREVRLFPWQRKAAPRKTTDDTTVTMGILVFAHVKNHGSGTTLANWELSIELPDKSILKPQKWPVQRKMRIRCEDGPIELSKDTYLDGMSKEAVQKNEERSGVIVWMLRDIRIHTLRTKNSVYTLTARDNAGVVHSLERFTLAALPQQCFEFNVLD